MQKDPEIAARRMLVLVTDGEDDASHVGRDEAVAAAQQTGTVIFSLSTNESQYEVRVPRCFNNYPQALEARSLNYKTGV